MSGIHGVCCCRGLSERNSSLTFIRICINLYNSFSNTSNINMLCNTMIHCHKFYSDITFTNLIIFVQEQYVLIHEVLASFMATFQTYNNFKC